MDGEDTGSKAQGYYRHVCGADRRQDVKVSRLVRLETIAARADEPVQWRFRQPAMVLFWWRQGFGRFSVDISGSRASSCKGDEIGMALIPPGAAAEGKFEITDACEYDVALLEPELLAQVDVGCHDVPLACLADDVLRSGMLELSRWRHDATFSLMAEGWALQAVGRLNRLIRSEVGRSVAGMGAAQVGRVRDFVGANLSGSIGVDDLANEAGVALADISASFKASTGLTLAGFTRLGRLREARRLLIETCQSVDEIARATGFVDASSLRRSFRAREGMSPAEFRRLRRS
ncbi:helix-turn-helix domain-containing protein [Sphingobium yanoikuyae]|nr:AraC family transcriptional regulator [Sphingobium yanoikuyae]